MTGGDLRDARILVTGATGFLGAHVVRLLAGAGADVHTPRIDLLDEVATRTAFAAVRPDVIIHLAAYGARPGQSDRDRAFAVNVRGSVNLWSAAPASVRRVVVAGSSAEYASADGPVNEHFPCEPRSSYGASKHAAVSLLGAFAREDRRSLVVLRPFGAYGPGDDSDRVIPFTLRRLIAGDVVPLSSGDQLRDFAFVEDQARAFLAAAVAKLPEPVAMYNVGGGAPVVLRSVLEAAADAVGPGTRARLHFGALPNRPGESAVCADISAARRDLGYEPAVSLEEGLARTVRWLRSSVQV